MEEHGPRPIGLGLSILGYTIGDWCASPDGTGKPVAVAICLELRDLPPLVLRLKSRKAVNEMIHALQKHRDSVFAAGKPIQN